MYIVEIGEFVSFKTSETFNSVEEFETFIKSYQYLFELHENWRKQVSVKFNIQHVKKYKGKDGIRFDSTWANGWLANLNGTKVTFSGLYYKNPKWWISNKYGQ